MKEYQYWGILADGTLAFAGCKRHGAPTVTLARKVAREWKAWALDFVARVPGGYPLAVTVRALPVNPLVEIRFYPVGEREKCQAFKVGRMAKVPA